MDAHDLILEENRLIKEGEAVIKRVEENIRSLKIEYQKTLKDYERLRNGDKTIFEEMEPEYLKLLAKLKQTIEESTSVWDRSIANVEQLRQKKKEKIEYFRAGAEWSLKYLQIPDQQRLSILIEINNPKDYDKREAL